VVEIHQVKKMVEGTKKGLMIEVHHIKALREYAKATQDNLSRLAKRISEQATFLWGQMEEISSKAAVSNALKPIRAISSIFTRKDTVYFHEAIFPFPCTQLSIQ
jgi:hypothetical protein